MKNNNISLITGILFTIVGLVVFFNPEVVVKFMSYFLGGVLIAFGGYKIANYSIHSKKTGIRNHGDLAFGVIAIILGILFIFLAGTIELIVRFIIGAWLIIAGLGKLSNTFYTKNRSRKFYSLICIGIIYIIIGLYIILVSNLAFSIIGLFMAIYGITDLTSFFVCRDIFTQDDKEKPKRIDVKENKKLLTVKEAEVEEKK